MSPNFSRLTEFMHEVGQLRLLQRSGYAFLGSGKESVAEHTSRTAVIAWILARLSGADAGRAVLMALFHDLGEARTGDQNYVNRTYVDAREREAVRDAVDGTGFEQEILGLWDEHESRVTEEGKIVRDADQLDLMLNLKRELDLGNVQAEAWLESVQQRLVTDIGKAFAEHIRTVHHTAWWLPAVSK